MQSDFDGGLGAGRHRRGPGPEHRVAALTLALLLVGGAMGSVNLFVDGVLRDGAPRWVYAGTMAPAWPPRSR